MKKYIVLAVIGLVFLACVGNKKDNKSSVSLDGQKLFKQNCVLCHGENGKLGLNGSKDLTKSTLTIAERIDMVTKGKGTMMGFGSLLSQEEIKAVAAYTFKLKK